MALNVVLVTQKQSPKGLCLTWSAMEGVSSYLVFIATRKLTPDELSAAVASNGNADCIVVKLGPAATSVVDDASPQGESRCYGVAMNFSEGAPHAARFRCVPDGGKDDSLTLTGAGVKKQAAKPVAAAPAPAPAAPAASAPVAAARTPTGNTGSYRVGSTSPSSGSFGSTSASASASASSAAPSASPSSNSGSFRVNSPSASPAGNSGAFRISNTGAPVVPAVPAVDDDLEARKRAQAQARARLDGSAAPATPAATPAARSEEKPAEDPMEARRRQQAAARAARDGEAPAPAAAAAKPEEKAAAPAEKPAEKPAETPAEDPMEARKRQQAAARAARDGDGAAPAPASNEPVPPPSQFPLDESFDFHMSGGTQTWDGLRIYWEREPRAAAYEVLVSDHQIFGDELADALAGKGDFTSSTALNPSVTAVIDNITPREARGWYLVLVRAKDGKRTPHPFQVGDAATSGKTAVPFVNPNRTGELRAEVEGMLADAKEQWARWKSEQDGGARREAKRLVQDAQLMYPNHPGAKSFAEEMG